MRTLILCLFVVGIAGLVVGCSSGCGDCEPAPCCEDVYESPCCPAPSQGMGWNAGGSDTGADAGGGGGSCGGGGGS